MFQTLVLALIRLYQRTLSLNHGLLGLIVSERYCRFHPTCSEYTYQAIFRFGVFRGGWMGFARILHCHPWSEGGYDPVCHPRENVKNLKPGDPTLAQFETGHPQHLTRESRGGLAYRVGDQIEGRHAPVTPRVKEPALIRQKHPPVSVQGALPAAEKPDKIKVKCRQAIRSGQPQTIPLTQARGKFQSHQLKCQNCQHRMLCATA